MVQNQLNALYIEKSIDSYLENIVIRLLERRMFKDETQIPKKLAKISKRRLTALKFSTWRFSGSLMTNPISVKKKMANPIWRTSLSRNSYFSVTFRIRGHL